MKTVKEQRKTVKCDYHTPVLREHGRVTDTTGDAGNDPLMLDAPECWS